MIRTKDINFVSEALKFAHKHKSPRGYMMVAFLVQNKKIVSIGINNYKKTHAKTIQTQDYIIPQHSEVKCISKWIVKNKKITSDMTLYVVGLTQGKIGQPVISSKPCESCEKFIRFTKIPRVVFVENDFVNEIQIKEMRIE